MEGTVDALALVDAVRDAGLGTVSPSQLKRLRREGLLQPTIQHHTIGRSGSDTLYPAKAVSQLIGILRIRQQRRQRPFEAVAFLAWEEGLWVEHTKLRRVIADWVRQSAATVQRLGSGDDAEDQAAERSVTLAKGTTRHPVASVVKRNIAGSDIALDDFLYGVMQQAQQLEDADMSAELLDRATGFGSFAEEAGQAISLPRAYGESVLPPVSAWPRIVSRASRLRLLIGSAFLTMVKQLSATDVLPEELVPKQLLLDSDTDVAIGFRALIAARAIVGERDFARWLTKATTGEDL